MTIHADFVKILKENNIEAFSDKLKFKPDLVFIDGQVKLMKAESINTWPTFLNVQFFSLIDKCFQWGADTIVLGFDNYNHVPVSKTMTQIKRNKHVPDFKFNHTDELPTYMPSDWNSAMRNRTFKVKVIEKILRETKLWFTARQKSEITLENKCLIFDFYGVPEVISCFHHDKILNFIGSREWDTYHSKENVGRGECDIKAFTWMSISKVMLIVSTDGDYVPLGLLQMLKQHETNQVDITMETDAVKQNNECCKIILYRMTTQINTCKKRDRDDNNINENGKKKRTYEFVFLPLIATFLQDCFPSTVQHPIRQFCSMVASCGCDFAMNLPRVGPRTLWKFASKIEHLNLSCKEDLMFALAIVYDNVFKINHFKKSDTNFNISMGFDNTSYVCSEYNNIMMKIKSNKTLSTKVKDSLWNIERAWAHSKNIIWTFKYWSELNCCPLPHSEDFGYILDNKNRTHFAAVEII